jgi:hypothetical protein
MHSTEEPADAESNGGSGIGLGFNGRAKPLFKPGRSVAGGVGSLAVQVLRSAGCLIEPTSNLSFGIAHKGARTFFNLAANVFVRARYAILIHGDVSSWVV